MSTEFSKSVDTDTDLFGDEVQRHPGVQVTASAKGVTSVELAHAVLAAAAEEQYVRSGLSLVVWRDDVAQARAVALPAAEADAVAHLVQSRYLRESGTCWRLPPTGDWSVLCVEVRITAAGKKLLRKWNSLMPIPRTEV